MLTCMRTPLPGAAYMHQLLLHARWSTAILFEVLYLIEMIFGENEPHAQQVMRLFCIRPAASCRDGVHDGSLGHCVKRRRLRCPLPLVRR
jgi:hypothetical protein